MAKFTTSHPARTLNTNFTPNVNNYTLVRYTVQIVATASLIGGQSGSVELRCDAAATPTEVQDECTSAFVITLGVGIGWTSTQKWSLSYVVPPGHNVRLVTSGGATITLTRVTEQTISPEFDGVDFATDFSYK